MKNTPKGKQKTLPKRIDKALDWLETSRDVWKEKTTTAKDELKKSRLAVKRARSARDSFKAELSKNEEAYLESQKKMEQKDCEIALLKKRLEEAYQQIDALKKKT